MFGVHDQLSVDFLDKMPDKQRDLKMICASALEDFLKVLSFQADKCGGRSDDHLTAKVDKWPESAGQGGLVINVNSGPPKVILESAKEERALSATSSDKFLISSKPFVRKCTSKLDKAVNICWETHYRSKKFDLFVTT